MLRLALALLIFFPRGAAAEVPATASAAVYAMKVSITAHGPWVRAGQLLQGEVPKKLAEIKVRRLEAPGKTIEISRDFLALKLHEARLGNAVIVSGTATLVTASSRLIKGAEIKAFAEGYLKERLGSLSGTAEVELLCKDIPGDLLVPDRDTRLDLAPPAGGRFRGNLVLRVLARQAVDDGSDIQVGQALLSCLATVKQSLLVARRPIRHGEAISAENSALSLVDATYLLEDGYADPSEALGLKARTYLAADKVIFPSALERPPLVKRGDIVKLTVKAGLISVNVSARAMRDGALGDSIPVEIVDSKKQVQARVLDQGSVVSESR